MPANVNTPFLPRRPLLTCPQRECNPDVFSVPIDEDWLDAQAALRYAELAAEAILPTTPIQLTPVDSKLGPLQCVVIPPTPIESPISPPHSATPSTKSSVQWIHRQPKAGNPSPSSWRNNLPQEPAPVPFPNSSPLDIKPPPHRRFPSMSSVSSQSSAASSAMPMTPPEWSTTNLNLSSSAPPNVARSILARTASKRSASSTATTAKSVKFNERPMVYSPIYDFTSESEREDARRLVPSSILPPSSSSSSGQKKRSPLRRLLTATSKSTPQPPSISGPFALGSFNGGRRPDLECERVRPKGARARPDKVEPQHARRSSFQLHRVSSVESMKSARSIGGRSVRSESGKSVLSISSISSLRIRNWIENFKSVGRRAG